MDQARCLVLDHYGYLPQSIPNLSYMVLLASQHIISNHASYLNPNSSVENYTNPLALLVPLWPYRITMFITVFTALIMHMFLSYRIMRLTNRLLCILMLALTALTFTIGLACSTVTWMWVRTAVDMPRVNVIMSVWFGFEMITDTLLSGTLISILLKSRSHFPKSETIVNTLVRTAVQTGEKPVSVFSSVIQLIHSPLSQIISTGLAGSIFSILTLAFYIIRKETQIFAIFGIPIARVYTNASPFQPGQIIKLIKQSLDLDG
ncbi:hypothetical protein CVT24_004532 [Panaeolus cyanescens]|uniref:Uncharacterized protein n=1 Tax=Panaeolus cyanescens TaxID=181874 RepID=A0A409YBT5_9AGAR|nr:hypothetical protein CVT24_004532 [Panaeolus cyanescens]